MIGSILPHQAAKQRKQANQAASYTKSLAELWGQGWGTTCAHRPAFVGWMRSCSPTSLPLNVQTSIGGHVCCCCQCYIRSIHICVCFWYYVPCTMELPWGWFQSLATQKTNPEAAQDSSSGVEKDISGIVWSSSEPQFFHFATSCPLLTFPKTYNFPIFSQQYKP